MTDESIAVKLYTMSTNTEQGFILAGYQRALLSIAKVPRDADNPYFKSKYIPLKGIQKAVRDALLPENLAVRQNVDYDPQGQCVIVTTKLVGIFETAEGDIGIELEIGTTRLPVPKMTPQDAGSAFSYGRRYALGALFDILESEDDDGEGVQAPHRAAPAPKPIPLPIPDTTAVSDNFADANTAPSFTARGKVHVWADKNAKQLGTICYASSLPELIKQRAKMELVQKSINPKDIDGPAALEILAQNEKGAK